MSGYGKLFRKQACFLISQKHPQNGNAVNTQKCNSEKLLANAIIAHVTMLTKLQIQNVFECVRSICVSHQFGYLSS